MMSTEPSGRRSAARMTARRTRMSSGKPLPDAGTQMFGIELSSCGDSRTTRSIIITCLMSAILGDIFTE
jgi:hypothetical protein